MLESIINPKSAKRGPWKMFFVGLVYATISLILVKFIFATDTVLSQYSGMLVVLFCVMFSLPFMYFIIKREERTDEVITGFWPVCKAHADALLALMCLFLGFVVAFSILNAIFQDPILFNAQLETYCMINSPGNIEGCVETFSINRVVGTGNATKIGLLLGIIENNVGVMIFTLIFSLLFGAGAIFILAWNASVIAAAVGVITKYQFGLEMFHKGIAMYMFHGFLEIGAYFITAMAGGVFGVGILRRKITNVRLLKVIQNSILLLFIALILLIIAAFVEVYITPIIFG